MEKFDLLMPCKLVIAMDTEDSKKKSQGGEGRPIDVNFGFLGKQNMPVTQQQQRFAEILRKNPRVTEEQQQLMQLLKNIFNTQGERRKERWK